MSIRRAGEARTIGPATTINTAQVHPYLAAQLADSPAGAWMMQETSGAVLIDSSGNDRHGSYVGGPTLGASGIGSLAYAVDFAADWTKYAKIANASWFNTPNTAITLEAVYVCDNYASLSTVVSMDDYGTNPRKATLRYDSAGGGPNFAWGTSGSVAGMSGGPAQVNGTNYHGAMVYNGSTVKAYINGSEVLSYAVTGTLNSWAQDCFIGRSAYTGSGNGAWDGRICGVGWYHTALSAARILAHAQAAGLA